MIFRTSSGDLIEIICVDYTNDRLYYKKILETKNAKSTILSVPSYSSYLIEKQLNLNIESNESSSHKK